MWVNRWDGKTLLMSVDVPGAWGIQGADVKRLNPPLSIWGGRSTNAY